MKYESIIVNVLFGILDVKEGFFRSQVGNTDSESSKGKIRKDNLLVQTY